MPYTTGPALPPRFIPEYRQIIDDVHGVSDDVINGFARQGFSVVHVKWGRTYDPVEDAGQRAIVGVLMMRKVRNHESAK